ncbi:subtilisin [Trichoderma cornu-damae]|uniref:Subtilisin n=1 Tax=Trichoderma cornu-damae TaxID=654480 RepID=A0A9P8QM95_9HYPO|nr:subtilisin [Trichoderma cornu-damae]
MALVPLAFIAGKTFRVAEKASIAGAKVSQGSSTSSSAMLSGFTCAANEIVTKNCTTNPPRPASAVTAGAIDAAWGVADSSNWAEAVDILAPGTDITSAWNGGDNDQNTISGASMATPHIVGLPPCTPTSLDGVTW